MNFKYINILVSICVILQIILAILDKLLPSTQITKKLSYTRFSDISHNLLEIDIESPREYLIKRLKQYNLTIPMKWKTYFNFEHKLPHIIYIDHTGRTGNRMFSYSKLWGVYRMKNIIPIFKSQIFTKLNKRFPNLQMLFPKGSTETRLIHLSHHERTLNCFHIIIFIWPLNGKMRKNRDKKFVL